MTYAIAMMKGIPVYREKSLNYLSKLENNKDFYEQTGTSLECVFVCFGWPDFIILLKSENVELIKEAIVKLREDIKREIEDNIETSTIICSTLEEIEKRKKEFFSNSITF